MLGLADEVCRRSDEAREKRVSLQHAVESLTGNVHGLEDNLVSVGIGYRPGVPCGRMR